MYTFEWLKENREFWKTLEYIPVECSWCNSEFETRYGTLYNIIRREADGIYCSRKCAGAARTDATQKKYLKDGGKTCKRCGEFKELDNFSPLPNPPFFRAECKRCHNYKPARQYSLYKDKAHRSEIRFNLSLDEFLEFWQEPCFYCNESIDSIRLEMKESSIGFNSANIVSVCRDCQKFKGSLEHKEFLYLCHKISDNVREREV